MSTPPILVCHPDRQTAARLCALTSTAYPGAPILNVDNLMHAYHLAEHHQPLCLIIDEQLAASDDFALLSSLLQIMKVGCMVVCCPQSRCARPIDNAFAHFDLGAPQAAFDAALHHAVQRHKGVPTIQPQQQNDQKYGRHRLIVIGASTGGIDALAQVLRHFTPATPPVLIVQHTGANFVPSMIRLLNSTTRAQVKSATDGELLSNGTVYFAPHNDVHLCIARSKPRRLVLTSGDPVSGHRPSIDMLFHSAEPWGKDVAAALLTGMGRDGAAGLKSLRQAGAHTIGQDDKTSVVYGMPRVAMEIGAVTAQLPIDKIGPALLDASLERTGQ